MSKKEWFIEMESTPGEDAVKLLKWPQKNFSIVHKLSLIKQGTDSNLERRSTLGKNAIE